MDYAEARRLMVASQVRPNDVFDGAILDALETVPREAFLPSSLRPQAYADREIAYGDGRALPSARDFAKLLVALAPTADETVIDAGCGSGYSTAVLARLCAMVVAVEADADLAAAAEKTLADLDIVNAAVVVGDPAEGAPGQGPFDAGLVAGVVEARPDALIAQLKDGGRLAAMVRDGPLARGTVWRRAGDAISSRVVFDASARTVVPGFAKPKGFVFQN